MRSERACAATAAAAALAMSAPAPAELLWVPLCDPARPGALRPIPVDGGREEGRWPGACHAALRPKEASTPHSRGGAATRR